jgi:hypothetical protein
VRPANDGTERVDAAQPFFIQKSTRSGFIEKKILFERMGFFKVFQYGKELYREDGEVDTACRTPGMACDISAMQFLKLLYLFIDV